jgi:hypothetical protein
MITAIVGVEPWHLAGVARVTRFQTRTEQSFPTAGNAEFNADRRDERGGRDCDCPTVMPGYSPTRHAMRSKQIPVCTSTSDSRAGNFARKGFPTARLAERGLRENQANEPPRVTLLP